VTEIGESADLKTVASAGTAPVTTASGASGIRSGQSRYRRGARIPAGGSNIAWSLATFFGRDSGADLTVWAAWERAPTYKRNEKSHIYICMYVSIYIYIPRNLFRARFGGGFDGLGCLGERPYLQKQNETGIEWANTVMYIPGGGGSDSLGRLGERAHLYKGEKRNRNRVDEYCRL